MVTRQRRKPLMTKTRNAVFFVLMLVFTLALVEALSFFAGRLLQAKWGMWKPPAAAKRAQVALSYEQYLQRRDPLLGWPYPMQYGVDLDVNGAQRSRYFPNGAKEGSCVSLYGDSFTQGGDTSSPEKNWGQL